MNEIICLYFENQIHFILQNQMVFIYFSCISTNYKLQYFLDFFFMYIYNYLHTNELRDKTNFICTK